MTDRADLLANGPGSARWQIQVAVPEPSSQNGGDLKRFFDLAIDRTVDSLSHLSREYVP